MLNKNPGPGSYAVEPAPTIKNSVYKKDVQNFGTLAERNSTIMRDPT